MLVLWCSLVLGQAPLTSNFFNYHLVDRYEITTGHLDSFVFTATKPYSRAALANSVRIMAGPSDADKFNLDYLYVDLQEYTGTSLANYSLWGSRTFYTRKNALYYVDHQVKGRQQLQLLVNPILGFEGGFSTTDSLQSYRNSRGVQIRGSIGGKVGFFTQATENQFRFPDYQRQRIDTFGVVEGTGLYKKFGARGHDFFTTRGYITFSPIKEIMVQFGHDRNFIGNGYRSLILSDRAKEYPFLKFNTRVWKLNYQNLFMQHTDYSPTPDGELFDRKFSAFHHLGVNIGKNLNIGLFENVIFHRGDSISNGGFDLNYLNPIIFYRAVEHGLNSADNVILGLDWKWNFAQRFSFYGQLVLDEFVKNEALSFSTSWVNKQAWQAGLKYVNVLNVSNLDLQVEMNQVRPYVYSHISSSGNWIHHDQALAHPLGANFREWVGILRYVPVPRVNICMLVTWSKQGIDTLSTTNIYGGNVLLDYNDVLDKNNAPLFQGLEQTTLNTTFSASYMLFHNLFADLRIHHRQNTLLSDSQDYTVFAVGLRLNTGMRFLD